MIPKCRHIKPLNFILALICQLVFASALFFFGTGALAHPVSFEGGYSLMSEFSTLRRETSFIYSPSFNTGAGVTWEQMDRIGSFTSLQLSWLVQRWNLNDAQGNIYAFGGPGYFDASDLNLQVNSFGNSEFRSDSFYRYGFQADYETRKFYSMVRFSENRVYTNSKNNNDILFNMLDLRLGFAPYKGNYNQLNSWLILNLRSDTNFHKIMIIPTLRFYFNNYLWEVAQDLDGNSHLNFMTRF